MENKALRIHCPDWSVESFSLIRTTVIIQILYLMMIMKTMTI
jgi:hypothetical protein